MLVWQEVDLLLNDGSKHISILDWRTNTDLIRRVEMGRRHSRRCLLMSSLLAKTAPEQVSSSNLLCIRMPFVSIRYLPLFLMKFFGWHAISFSSRVRRMNCWLLSTMIAFKMWYPFMIKGLHCQSRTQHGRHFVKILWSILRRLLKSSNRTFLIIFMFCLLFLTHGMI